jgi:predicted esterase
MRRRALPLLLVPTLLAPAAPAAAVAAKPEAVAGKAPKVTVVKQKRRTLARTGRLVVRVRAYRAQKVVLASTLAGVAGPATRTKRVRFRRAGTRTVTLQLAAYARSVLGGCVATRLTVTARAGRSGRAAQRFGLGIGCRPRERAADGKLGEWRGTPTHLSGQTTMSRGELIYTDWLYDDYGPDLDGAPGRPPFRAHLVPTEGDYRYPADEARYGNNAADLRELRVAADADGLHLLISLQTMKAADAAIATLAIDADGSAATSGGWPDGIGLQTQGPERFITTWGTGARLTTPEGTRELPAFANLEANAIELEVPLDALGPLAEGARAWVVTGLHDGAGRYAEQSAGATAVFNAGFRAQEEFPRLQGGWSERGQSRALAAGDIEPYSHPLALAKLQAGVSDPPFAPKPGYYNRVFRSAQSLGEGIVLAANSGSEIEQAAGGEHPTFLSPWQPYGLYVPEGYKPGRPNPLTLDGHSLDSNHNQYRFVAPRQLGQLGDERGSLIITPLARGADTWYLDTGLVDVLEAWEDVRRAYDVDAERTAITGYSMGGYMTYRLGLLMPDRFSRASVYVGPPAYAQWPYPAPVQSTPRWLVAANTNQLAENALNLPYEIVHGNADELVPVSGVQQQADTFLAAGNAVRFYRHAADDHLSFILNDEWKHTQDFLGAFPRERDPLRVRYRRFPAMDLPQRDLVFDGAYWVDGIDVRDGSAPDANAFVDATTHGRGGRRLVAERRSPQPVSGPVTPGTLTAQELVEGKAIERANAFEVTLRNVRSARFDLARMGLGLAQPLRIEVDSDGPATLLLGDRRVEVAEGKATLTVG